MTAEVSFFKTKFILLFHYLTAIMGFRFLGFARYDFPQRYVDSRTPMDNF